MKNNIYNEKQSFLNWWLCGLLIILLGIEVNDIYSTYQTTKNLEFGVGFWIISVISIAFLLIRLNTKIDANGILITFIPFVYKRRFPWEDIASIYIREYSITDFGGWGYRISSQGKAYNTKGKYGLQLIMKSGEKIMIGTQRPQELEEIIKNYKDETK